jgi:hypothetical protein
MGKKTTVAAGQAVWQLLALGDAALESTDLVLLNLTVARGVPSLANLDVARYASVVDEWTQAFARELPRLERTFASTPWKWKNDIHFFRVGMLAGFLGHEIGIRYIEEHKHATSVTYTNPSQLFINGLIDTKEGSCGNMAALHVAMCRKIGWPVSLACVKSHFISRFDDGEVIHNIEATNTHPGSFASDTDEWYMKKEGIPQRAIDCGSDLRSLTPREMIGAFLGLRARHFKDVGDLHRADLDYALSRVLFPSHRRAYIGAMVPMLRRGEGLFDRGELGHPDSLFEDLAPMFAEGRFQPTVKDLRAGVHSFPIAARPLPTHEVINGVVMTRLFSKAQIEGTRR